MESIDKNTDINKIAKGDRDYSRKSSQIRQDAKRILSVENYDTIQKSSSKKKKKKGECPSCHRITPLDKNGNLTRHKGYFGYCTNTGKPKKESKIQYLKKVDWVDGSEVKIGDKLYFEPIYEFEQIALHKGEDEYGDYSEFLFNARLKYPLKKVVEIIVNSLHIDEKGKIVINHMNGIFRDFIKI